MIASSIPAGGTNHLGIVSGVEKNLSKEMWSFLLWHPIVIKEAAESRIPVCLICGINMLSLKEGGGSKMH